MGHLFDFFHFFGHLFDFLNFFGHFFDFFHRCWKFKICILLGQKIDFRFTCFSSNFSDFGDLNHFGGLFHLDDLLNCFSDGSLLLGFFNFNESFVCLFDDFDDI